MKPVLIYHGNCRDGFGSRFAFWMKYGENMEYVPASYGRECNVDFSNRDVFFADFSFDPDKMIEIKNKAKSLIIIDHHVSAERKLANLKGVAYDEFVYDVNHSGAYLSWKYLFGDKNIPNLINCIEDYDIWRHSIKDSGKILLYVDSFDYSEELWKTFITDLEPDSEKYNDILLQGSAIERFKNMTLNKLLPKEHKLMIGGFEVPAINSSWGFSELCGKICIDKPFAAVYYWDVDRYVFSLRSDENGEDVTKIASIYGGGGHKRASGFSVPNLEKLKIS